MSETRQRKDVPIEYRWDTESVYTTVDEWERDFARLAELLEPVRAAKGHLDSAQAVADLFQKEDALSQLIEKLYLYAHMKEDEDTSVGENQARMSRVRSEYAKIVGELSWIRPEILSKPEETLKEWVEDPALADNRRAMELLLREKPHTLSAEEERILGLASEVFSAPHQAFSKLTNADMTFEPAVDAQGATHVVTNGTVYSLLLSPDRELRHNAWASLYKTYEAHINTIAELLAGSTKTHVLNARLRNFPGALEASLFKDNIPPSVYHSLIEAVNAALPAFHDYLRLRARMLNLQGELNMWDIHVPIVRDFKIDVAWDECRQWIIDSLRPMGDDYMTGVQASFAERWYDVFENKGKRSGAYSTGAYGQKPYMLLNYHRTLNDVFTVAHELGHSMHTRLSHANQPYRYADYPIFLAEIASTTNEALLHEYLMRTKDDPALRAYLLNHLCDSFRGTLFRQTMFAEFELWIHRHIEEGGALTAESLGESYYELNAKYHGEVIDGDRRIRLEWSRIPHFYYNFYVYKYATGFAAAQIFSQQVLSGEEGREKYLGLLRSGSSRDPLDTVREAGVDLANPDVLQKCFATFGAAVSDLSETLDALGAGTNGS